MLLRVLIVGGGGREHAIAHKLSQSKRISKLYCAPGNGGIAGVAECVPIKASDIEGVVNFSKENNIDLVVVAPDDPLVLGMVDALEANGIRAFGPRKNAAIIEGSKVFSKELMKKYHIPTAEYEVYDNPKSAIEALQNASYPAVIKAEGLALGKGVVIAQNLDEAANAVHSMMEEKIFGESGNRIVIEEFLTGREVSMLAFTDGETIKTMVSSEDHKRVYDFDQGPNTGGMGTISPSPIYTEEIHKECMEKIYIKTIEAMNKEGRPFKGCIYFGLIITTDGPKVIEYNARFGDPETQVVLPRLKTDLLDIFEAIIDEKLADINIEWDNGAAACVIMASGGYPAKYPTNIEIFGLCEAEKLYNVTVYHAGTKLEENKVLTAGGRVLGVTATGNNLSEALETAYKAVRKISFEGAHYRNDIGKK